MCAFRALTRLSLGVYNSIVEIIQNVTLISANRTLSFVDVVRGVVQNVTGLLSL